MATFNGKLGPRLEKLGAVGLSLGKKVDPKILLTPQAPPRPVPPAEMTQIEERLGVTLPSDYRDHLLHVGGVFFPKTNSVSFANSDRPGSEICDLWGSKAEDNEENTILWAVECYRGRMPDTMIPIGSDPFGNLFCIGAKGGDHGKVFFWDHELESDRRNFRGNISLVAESFEEFVSRLRNEDDDDS